tara:strand:- start:423 stop:887 length:465 start_codon:yes stop_codon:yes gene_type:complete
MIHRYIDFILIVLALIVVSCLLSTMVTFMGGHRGGADMSALLLMQLASIPVSVFLIAAGLFYIRRDGNWESAFRSLWNTLPQWLLFMFFFLNSLVVIGEIALYIASQVSGWERSWLAHIPLASMLATSAAFLTLYAAQHFDNADHRALSGRWSG